MTHRELKTTAPAFLVPALVQAIREGHNTPELLLKYFPHAELVSYCKMSENPYKMITKLMCELRKRGLIHYSKTKRTWSVV